MEPVDDDPICIVPAQPGWHIEWHPDEGPEYEHPRNVIIAWQVSAFFDRDSNPIPITIDGREYPTREQIRYEP